MKKISWILIACFLGLSVNAQNYDPIKTLMMLNQVEKAKADLDKSFANSKFTSKAEAFILKATVYSAVAGLETKKNTPEADQLILDADASFSKYKEMDPATSLLSEPLYQNGAINLYSGFYTMGYSDYQKKNWEAGLNKLKRAIDYSEILIKNKLLTSPLDLMC